jgi:hypothetical protein
MAKWIIINPESGNTLTHEPEHETLEFDNGQHAAAGAAAFLIDFPDVEVRRPTEEEAAAIHEALEYLGLTDDEQSAVEEEDEESEVPLTELHLVCLEHGVRIRMIREAIEPIT